MTLGEALAEARQQVPVAEARLLLQEVLGMTAAALAARPEQIIAADRLGDFRDWVARRAAGEPVAYLLGRREFYGRDFMVSPAVLIPRPETELLVDLGRAFLADRRPARILDLGTGSGCLAITLALETGAEVVAADISESALAVARGNAERLGVQVEFRRSDWFAAIDGDFDLIVANPPYIADDDPHLAQGDLRFEPAQALSSGADGLAALRVIVAGAGGFLRPEGQLLMEHGYDQGQAVAGLLAAAGFRHIEQHRDLAGIVRASAGR